MNYCTRCGITMDSTSAYGTICVGCRIAPLPIVSPALTEADVRRIVREELESVDIAIRRKNDTMGR